MFTDMCSQQALSPSPVSSEGSINVQSSGEREPLMKSRSSSVMTGVETKHKYPPIIQAIGYELNYWSGVFGTSVGRTLLFPKYYVGAALFFIGLGEIIGTVKYMYCELSVCVLRYGRQTKLSAVKTCLLNRLEVRKYQPVTRVLSPQFFFRCGQDLSIHLSPDNVMYIQGLDCYYTPN